MKMDMNKLIRIETCAKVVGISVSRLYHLSAEGLFVEPATRVGNVGLWNPADVEKWKRQRNGKSRRK